MMEAECGGIFGLQVFHTYWNHLQTQTRWVYPSIHPSEGLHLFIILRPQPPIHPSSPSPPQPPPFCQSWLFPRRRSAAGLHTVTPHQAEEEEEEGRGVSVFKQQLNCSSRTQTSPCGLRSGPVRSGGESGWRGGGGWWFHQESFWRLRKELYWSPCSDLVSRTGPGSALWSGSGSRFRSASPLHSYRNAPEFRYSFNDVLTFKCSWILVLKIFLIIFINFPVLHFFACDFHVNINRFQISSL